MKDRDEDRERDRSDRERDRGERERENGANGEERKGKTLAMASNELL